MIAPIEEEDFTVTLRREGGAAVVVPVGEIDLATVGMVRDELGAAEDGSGAIVLDLRGVRFMDTQGISLVIEAQLRLAQAAKRFVVVRAPETVQRLFDIAGISSRLTLVDDPSEVLGEPAGD